MSRPDILTKVRNQITDAITRVGEALREFDEHLSRAWDGSASNYDSTDAYCAACLIDVNSAAGRATKAQSHCMLPVEDPGGGVNFEGVQAAAGGRGITQVKKPDDVPEDEWISAVTAAANKIIGYYEDNDQVAPDSVWEAAGKEPPEERATNLDNAYVAINMQLYEMEDWPWLHGIYVDDDNDNSIFGIASAGGKLFRFPVTIANGDVTIGEMTQVVEEFTPVMQTRTQVLRDANGQWRWLSISSTAVLNRVGEIDSRELFDSFVAHAEETGEYPYRTFYHAGEALKYGQADFLARDGYCLITSGIFDVDGENGAIARAEIAMKQTEAGAEWGESIGFEPLVAPETMMIGDVTIPVYTSGICREISCVEESDAAALFTMSIAQEVTRMNELVKAKLAKLGVPDEDVEQMDERANATNRTVVNENLVARAEPSGSTEGQEVAASGETVPDDGPMEEIVFDDEMIDAVAQRLAVNLEPITDALQAFTDTVADVVCQISEIVPRIEALERTDEEKRRQWIEDMPRSHAIRATYRPSQQADDAPQPQSQETMADIARRNVESIPGAY